MNNLWTNSPPEIQYEDFSDCYITLETVLPPIEPSILIQDSWICTKGDLMVVMGQKKSGKSNALVYILATALMKEVDTTRTLGIRSIYTEKKVIYVDTEQSKQKTQSFINRVCRISGNKEKPKNLLFANIRHLDLEARLRFINNELFVKHSDASIIIVDGITDFIDSVNNEEKSKEIAELFLRQLGKDCSIVAVIHEGKDGNGARGHIGQEFERKCAGAVSITKDREKGIHKMKCKLIREGSDFEDILFIWDDSESGFVQLDQNFVKAISEKTQETKNEELKDLLRRIFAVNVTLDKKAVITGFLNYDKTIPQDVKPDSRNKAATRRFKLALELEFIIEENKNFKLNFER